MKKNILQVAVLCTSLCFSIVASDKPEKPHRCVSLSRLVGAAAVTAVACYTGGQAGAHGAQVAHAYCTGKTKPHIYPDGSHHRICYSPYDCWAPQYSNTGGSTDDILPCAALTILTAGVGICAIDTCLNAVKNLK